MASDDLDHKKARTRILWLLADPEPVRRQIEFQARKIFTPGMKLGELTDAQSMELRRACWAAANVSAPEAIPPPTWWTEDFERRQEQGRQERERMSGRIEQALRLLG